VPDEASGGGAVASAWLVDTLAAMLHQRALLAHPEGPWLIFEYFTCSFTPHGHRQCGNSLDSHLKAAACDRNLRSDTTRGLCCAPGAEQCAVLLRLLAAALMPLMRQTYAWVASGVLHDPASEFFITKGEAC